MMVLDSIVMEVVLAEFVVISDNNEKLVNGVERNGVVKISTRWISIMFSIVF